MSMADPDTHDDDSTETLALDEAGDVTLPIVDVLTGRAFLSGKSGSGKSNSASVVVEELLDAGYPVLIVDTDGEYYGLKEEYELLHAGADEECDIQVSVEHAEKLANLALEENVPIILDVSGYLDTSEANDLVRETSRHLFTKEKKLKKPFLLVVEEVHEYIPEGGGMDATGEMLVKVGKRGRKHGLGIMGISQRPADVKKDFITQANWLLWHRLTWDNDTKVVGRIVGNEYADEVQDLGDGEAFLQADFLETDVQRVQVRRKRTFDAGATPDLDDFERPDLKSVSGDLVDELEQISDRESQRQDRISELEAELDARDERIEDLQQELENQEDIASAAQQMANALQGANGEGGGVPEDFEAKLEAKNEEIHDLEARLDAVREERDHLQDRVDDLEAEVERLQGVEERVEQAERIEDTLAEVRELVGADTQPATPPEETADLREELQEKEARIEDLEARLENADGGVSVPTDYHEFVKDDVVQDVIEEAKAETSAAPRYVKGVVAAVLEEGGPVDYETVADRLGVSTTGDVSKAASTLETMGVLERVQQSPAEVDFDLAGVEEIKAKQRRREETERVMESL